MKTILFTCLIALSGLTVRAQEQKPEPKDGEMKQYFFVMLSKGPNRSQDKATADQLQKDHIANIERLAKEGHLNVAGPFGDEGNWRGIFIFKTKTLEETKAMVESDPMIKAGRLAYEIHPWWCQKGVKFQ